MKDFKKPGRFGGPRVGGGGGFGRPNFGRPSFGGGNRGGRDDGFGRSQMFEAICANCGKRCEVPFRPNGQKPVYCKDCFGRKEHAPSNDFQKRDFSAPAQSARPEVRDGRIDELKRQLEAVNAKLDRLLHATERPVSAPVAAPAAVQAEAPKKTVVLKVSKKKVDSKKKK